MKINRHNSSNKFKRFDRLLATGSPSPVLLVFVTIIAALTASTIAFAIDPPSLEQRTEFSADARSPGISDSANSPDSATKTDDPQIAMQRRIRQEAAANMVQRTVRLLTSGPAFDAKLTQEIRAQGRSAVGVGRYEQAGGNTGRVSMEMMIPTSNGKCLLQQMCDGRLAWTREQVGEDVRLRRVDVGRLDELIVGQPRGISPRLRVGGLVELLERALNDFALEQVPAELEGEPVWMLRGKIRPTAEERILQSADREDWPPLCPRAIAIAIAAGDGENGFGKGLPVRFEYWTHEDPQQRRLVSYLKIYDLRAIDAAPETHFRFETGESDVNYFNDTQRYLDHFGIQVTNKQQRLLTR